MSSLRTVAWLLILCNLFVLGKVAELPARRDPETGYKIRAYLDSHNESVVRLSLEGGGSCTGWVAAKNVVVTAAHCTAVVGERSDAHFESGRVEEFLTLSAGQPGTGEDWAVLVGDTGDAEPLKLALAPQEPESGCVFVGYGGLQKQKAMPCMVAQYRDEAEGLVLDLLGEGDFGDSGGPVLGANGEVIGLVFAITRLHDGITYAVPLQALHKALGH